MRIETKEDYLKYHIKNTQPIVLVVGCTGSGKTTAINSHKSERRKLGKIHLFAEMYDKDPD